MAACSRDTVSVERRVADLDEVVASMLLHEPGPVKSVQLWPDAQANQDQPARYMVRLLGNLATRLVMGLRMRDGQPVSAATFELADRYLNSCGYRILLDLDEGQALAQCPQVFHHSLVVTNPDTGRKHRVMFAPVADPK